MVRGVMRGEPHHAQRPQMIRHTCQEGVLTLQIGGAEATGQESTSKYVTDDSLNCPRLHPTAPFFPEQATSFGRSKRQGPSTRTRNHRGGCL